MRMNRVVEIVPELWVGYSKEVVKDKLRHSFHRILFIYLRGNARMSSSIGDR
jgi:hypothetical protein